jgi:hypothetical protein
MRSLASQGRGICTLNRWGVRQGIESPGGDLRKSSESVCKSQNFRRQNFQGHLYFHSGRDTFFYRIWTTMRSNDDGELKAVYV